MQKFLHPTILQKLQKWSLKVKSKHSKKSRKNPPKTLQSIRKSKNMMEPMYFFICRKIFFKSCRNFWTIFLAFSLWKHHFMLEIPQTKTHKKAHLAPESSKIMSVILFVHILDRDMVGSNGTQHISIHKMANLGNLGPKTQKFWNSSACKSTGIGRNRPMGTSKKFRIGL